MKKRCYNWLSGIVLLALTISACAPQESGEMTIDDRLNQYTDFTLTADLSELSENQVKMVELMIEASKEMDDVFWMQAYGDNDALWETISDPKVKRFTEINYGPWDRLNGNESFVKGVGPKPAGANYYPADMTKEEFESWENAEKASLYTLVRRDDSGNLTTIPYREAYKEQHEKAADLLKKAAELAAESGLKKYLNLRAEALLTGEYQPSDLAWMDMKNNQMDFVVGPIETYEDQLFGYKAAHEAYVLIKDMEWSERLSKYTQVLPELQKGLPVPDSYKQETPGRDSDLNAYTVVYYAGDCNAGSKTIAINLPNDEQVQLEKGTRRLQLKNAMEAKYDKILVPISGQLIAEDQREHITFDAFFGNTMFHEVAHGLGIKNTINGNGTVREALKEHASALEEGKADILGLYMVRSLRGDDMISEGVMEDNYVTFLTSIFRSIRFGSSSAHGKANLIRFNYFNENGAFIFDESTGTYAVDFDKIDEVTDALTEKILTLQGDGDYDGVVALLEKYGKVGPQLQASLDKVSAAGIPVDITFNQGMSELK